MSKYSNFYVQNVQSKVFQRNLIKELLFFLPIKTAAGIPLGNDPAV
jgi:hypothetical protein